METRALVTSTLEEATGASGEEREERERERGTLPEQKFFLQVHINSNSPDPPKPTGASELRQGQIGGDLTGDIFRGREVDKENRWFRFPFERIIGDRNSPISATSSPRDLWIHE